MRISVWSSDVCSSDLSLLCPRPVACGTDGRLAAQRAGRARGFRSSRYRRRSAGREICVGAPRGARARPARPFLADSRAGCGGIRRSVAAAIEAGRQFGRLRDATCPGRLTTAQAEALRLSPDSPTLDEGPGWFASALAVATERGTCEGWGTGIET